MSKFKVGDEAECLDDAGYNYITKGNIYTITGLYGDNIIELINDEGSNCGLFYKRFALVQAKYPNPPHKHCDMQIEKAKGANIQFWNIDE